MKALRLVIGAGAVGRIQMWRSGAGGMALQTWSGRPFLIEAAESVPLTAAERRIARGALCQIRDAERRYSAHLLLSSEDGVLRKGPEYHHEADAIIAGLQRVCGWLAWLSDARTGRAHRLPRRCRRHLSAALLGAFVAARMSRFGNKVAIAAALAAVGGVILAFSDGSFLQYTLTGDPDRTVGALYVPLVVQFAAATIVAATIVQWPGGFAFQSRVDVSSTPPWWWWLYCLPRRAYATPTCCSGTSISKRFSIR